MMSEPTLKQLGRIRISGEIEALTGLHIGGSSVGLAIGGADNTVVRNALDGRPYIPGSSLKGKMRGLLDRVYLGSNLTTVIEGKQPIRMHLCRDAESYASCFACNLFGITPEKVDGACLPTRLLFRDAPLTGETVKLLERSLYTDMPMTQVKTEVVIDRITSAATPRQIERVPAGARFHYEIVFNVYRETDLDWLPYVSEAMELLEHDYLGGQGSRGYGQVRFATRALEPASFNGLNVAEDSRYASWAKTFVRSEQGARA